ncbi:MAG: SAM-dependent methyltransferase, partial [Candidatus Kapaibacterium sp.]
RTAHSTPHLAELHPDALVIGSDRSTVRLTAAPHLPVNALVLRAECADFWELCVRDDVVFALHAIYYPNPYPKSEHLGRRWHGHAAFPTLLRISAAVELRSNMPWYAREFSAALRLCGVDAPAEEFEPDAMMTAFERKYAATGHALWRVHARIPSAIREKLTPRGSSVSI